MLRGWQEEVVCNLPLENFWFGRHLQGNDLRIISWKITTKY
jgi:hypothetical protein